MKTQKQSNGTGNYQIEKEYKTKWTILTALSDGQWHRNMDLLEKTKLSPRILKKHLDKMTKELHITEKKTDMESGKYPYPVYYKTTPELATYINAHITREETAKLFELTLNESKDPLWILDTIHANSQTYFLELLKQIQQNKNMTYEKINFFTECFLWLDYKEYTYKLIEKSRKIIDDIDIKQSLINQAKRQIMTHVTYLKSDENNEKLKQ